MEVRRNGEAEIGGGLAALVIGLLGGPVDRGREVHKPAAAGHGPVIARIVGHEIEMGVVGRRGGGSVAARALAQTGESVTGDGIGVARVQGDRE